MKSRVKISILILLFTNLISMSSCQTDEQITSSEVPYSDIDGWQILLQDTTEVKLFVSLYGDSKNLSGIATLFLTYNKEEMSNSSNKNGIFAGIGLGESDMFNLDMITFHYWPDKEGTSESSYMVGDCWSPSDKRQVLLDSEYVSPSDSTLNNISASTFSFTAVDVNGFKSKLVWTFTKDISSPDAYDWPEIQNWTTNEGKIVGVFGFNYPPDSTNSGKPGGHATPVRVLQIIDGKGLTNYNNSFIFSFAKSSIVLLFLALFF